MISTILRIALIALFVWAVVRFVMYLRPKPTYIVSSLEYPRHDQLELVEAGEYVDLIPASDKPVINVYRKGVAERHGLLGSLPEKYYNAVEPVLRKGELYEAYISDHSGTNLRLEIRLKVKELPDEYV